MIETVSFPDEMAQATYCDFVSRTPWCLHCGGFGVVSDPDNRWHVCPRGAEKGHGRFLASARWRVSDA